MKKITPFLWFDDNAEEAMNHYVSIFKDSEVTGLNRLPDGRVISGLFTLAGEEFMALNGGPQFKFTEAISLFVDCETQAEVDELWSKLLDGVGEEQQCGWLKDRYGLSWQIIPSVLMKYLSDPDPEKAGRVMQAMLQMRKIDIAALEAARAG